MKLPRVCLTAKDKVLARYPHGQHPWKDKLSHPGGLFGRFVTSVASFGHMAFNRGWPQLTLLPGATARGSIRPARCGRNIAAAEPSTGARRGPRAQPEGDDGSLEKRNQEKVERFQDQDGSRAPRWKITPRK